MLRHETDTRDLNAESGEFQCTQCPETFASKREVMRHKENEPDHEYCKLHDMDFESWEDHGIHRVNTREHKTCEHCYADFGSRDGLGLHIAQFHKGIKSCVCPYCDKKFKGGMAGLSMVRARLPLCFAFPLTDQAH